MGIGFLPYVYVGTVAAACTVLPLVGTILTILRLFIRSRSQSKFGADDYLVAAALACLWAMAAILLRGIAHGLIGYSSPPPPDILVDFQPPLYAEAAYLQYAFWICMVLTFGLVKLAIVFFYRRVFVVKRTGFFDIATWVVLAISALWTLATFLLSILQCGSQPSLYWVYLDDPTHTCLDGIDVSFGISVSDLITDIIVFFLPVPVVWGLQMPTVKKITVSLMIAAGAVSLVASAFRLYILVKQVESGYGGNIDYFLANTLMLYWSMLEAGLAVIAINIPTFGQFLGSRSMQSVVASVRSVLSLQSLQSQHIGDTNELTKQSDLRKHSSATEARGSSVVNAHHDQRTSEVATEGSAV